MFQSALGIVKKIFWLIWVLAALIFGAWFARDNPVDVAPLVFGLTLPTLSVGIYLAAMLFIGVLIGSMLSFFATFGKVSKVKRELKLLKRQLKKLEQAPSGREEKVAQGDAASEDARLAEPSKDINEAAPLALEKAKESH